jgi:hypothetical protein
MPGWEHGVSMPRADQMQQSPRPRRMEQSREAHHPAPPHHSPEGHDPTVARHRFYSKSSWTTRAWALC